VKIRRTAVVFPVPGGPRSTVFNGEKPWTAGRRAKARSFIWASRWLKVSGERGGLEDRRVAKERLVAHEGGMSHGEGVIGRVYRGGPCAGRK